MVIYIPYLIFSLIITIICYLTNWFVCLFADELGELHGFLKNWQTWDDSLDPRFFVVKEVWSFLKYDYDKHYEEYEGSTPELEEVGRTRWFTRFKEGGEHFTLVERIKRYFCRVLWLTRNNAYGFSFWFLGRKVDGKNMVWKISDDGKVKYGYDITQPWWKRAFIYKNDSNICGKFSWQTFLGWKISDELKVHQAMIANRIWFSFDD